MAYDRDQQSGTCGVVAAVLLVLFLVFVVAVGTIFWIRTRSLSQMAQDQMAMAREEAVQAQLLAEETKAETEAARERNSGMADANPETSDSIDAQITIGLDENGNVLLDDNAIQLGDLAAELQSMFDASSDQLVVVIQVSSQCPFEHVATTRTLCKEAGAGLIRLELDRD